MPRSDGFVLHFADAAKMLDTLGDSLDAAEHHRRGGGDVERVGLSHDVEPLVARGLLRRHVAPDTIHQDLRATAWQRVESRVTQSL